MSFEIIAENIKKTLNLCFKYRTENDDCGVLFLPIHLATGHQLVLFVEEKPDSYILSTNAFFTLGAEMNIANLEKKYIKSDTFSIIKREFLTGISLESVNFEYMISKNEDVAIQVLAYAEKIKNFYAFLHAHIIETKKEPEKTKHFKEVVRTIIDRLITVYSISVEHADIETDSNFDSDFYKIKTNIIATVKSEKELYETYFALEGHKKEFNKGIFLIEEGRVAKSTFDLMRKRFETLKIPIEAIHFDNNPTTDSIEQQITQLLH